MYFVSNGNDIKQYFKSYENAVKFAKKHKCIVEKYDTSVDRWKIVEDFYSE